jgi:hypothetical protein
MISRVFAILLLTAVIVIQSVSAQKQNALYTNRVVAAEPQGVTTVYSNGPVSTGSVSRSGVVAPNGYTWSESQSDEGNTTETNSVTGFGGTFPDVRLADNFTVPAGQVWRISSVSVWGFRTNWTNINTPFSGGVLQIWNGRPGDPGSSVIFGDLSTDRLLSSTSSNIYSIGNSTVPAPGVTPTTTRLLWENRLSISPTLTLGPGTYWIDFATSMYDNNPIIYEYYRNVVIPNQRTKKGWNARQFVLTDNNWVDVLDGGNPSTATDVPQDIAFNLNGFVSSTNNGASRFMDYDGDGKTDFVVTRWDALPTNPSVWYIMTNSDVPKISQLPWGVRTGTNPGFSGTNMVDIVLPADYDGDGTTDVAVYAKGRGSGESYFAIINSSDNTIRYEQFGRDGDNPRIMGDYDGDGKADLAVWRPGTSAAPQSYFWIQRSSDGSVVTIPWGVRTDRPFSGDFDGDGKMDLAVLRPQTATDSNTFYVLRSSDGGYSTTVFPFTFQYVVPGDYDGDGKTDFAVIRSSLETMIWTYQQSSDGQMVSIAAGNYSTDYPVQGDYDGDGKTDIAVWRKPGILSTSQSSFWVRRDDGSYQVVNWGNGLDSSVASVRAN